MKIETDFVLLLTASVDPKGMPDLTQPDAVDREDTYAQCFEYYIRNHPRVRKIIFAENSGWPLNRFDEIAARANLYEKDVEVLSFNCNNFPRERGKSFGELLLIEKALERSSLAKGNKYIGKMTGRNLLMNLTPLLEDIDSDFEFCCDIRDHNFYQFLGLPDCGHHCDSRFFMFTSGFYDRYLKGSYAACSVGDGYLIEGLLFDLVKATERTEPIIKRFGIEPDFRGMAGHFIRNKAKDYGGSSEIIKRRIRSYSRRVAPWLHI
jgi:hypothetical protein